MTDWATLLQKPANLTEASVAWRGSTPSRRNCSTASICGSATRRNGSSRSSFTCAAAEHPDPFTHGESLQLQCGRWYFHRSNGVYRGGSFKGLDLTFGDGTLYGGVLFRGLEMMDGTFIDGPSLLVDYLLTRTKAATVAVLDAMIANRAAWDASSPVFLEDVQPPRTQPLLCSGRVGLTLKNARNKPDATRYILRPYRYLTEPRKTAKGKPLMVLALHARGVSVEEIHRTTGCPRKSIQRYLEDFERGCRSRDFTAYLGTDLTPADLCRLHGTWHTAYPS